MIRFAFWFIVILLLVWALTGCSMFKEYVFVHPRYPEINIPEAPKLETSKGLVSAADIAMAVPAVLGTMADIYSTNKSQEEKSRAEAAIGALNSIGESVRFEKFVVKAQKDVMKDVKTESDIQRLVAYSKQLEVAIRAYNEFAKTNNKRSGMYWPDGKTE